MPSARFIRRIRTVSLQQRMQLGLPRAARFSRKGKTMRAKVVPVGTGYILITSEDFLNGFQAGHLAHKIDYSTVQISDRHLTSLLMEQLECVDHTELYNFGYLVGWFATLAGKGTQEVKS
jgi:hypothetical protein